jgi:ABC-type transporter Mla subunit MlaD
MWTWLIWAGLSVGFVATVAAAFGTLREVIRFFRQLGRSRRSLFDALDSAAAKAEQTARNAEALGGASERIDASLARLARSRRKLAVLQSAWDEATDVVGVVTAVYPRK